MDCHEAGAGGAAVGEVGVRLVVAVLVVLGLGVLGLGVLGLVLGVLDVVLEVALFGEAVLLQVAFLVAPRAGRLWGCCSRG